MFMVEKTILVFFSDEVNEFNNIIIMSQCMRFPTM